MRKITPTEVDPAVFETIQLGRLAGTYIDEPTGWMPHVLVEAVSMEQGPSSSGPVVTAEDVLGGMINRAQTAAWEVALHHRRMVKQLAWSVIKFRGPGNAVGMEDLESAGLEQAMRLAHTFDPSRGYTFGEYTRRPLRTHMSRELQKMRFTVYVPAAARNETLRAYHATNNLALEYGRSPSTDELAAELEIPGARLVELDRADAISHGMESLDELMQPKDESAYPDDVAVDSARLIDGLVPEPIDEAALASVRQKEVRALITGVLDQREAEVLRLRFGLDDGQARTLEEVGEQFNLTRERIRQIEARAFSKIRHSDQASGFVAAEKRMKTVSSPSRNAHGEIVHSTHEVPYTHYIIE